MIRNFRDLNKKTYDLIIIGGGIVGTGVARDAALRGLDTLLVEKEDFACGTTSRSTRLIHGGLRYLRMFEFKLVTQDLHEREVLLQIAPHLVNQIKFTIPLLRSKPSYRLALPLGLMLYDFLARGKSLPSRRHLSVKETLQAEPALAAIPDLVGSYRFYDCQALNMERLNLENALQAADKGACILNHTEATDFLREKDRVTGIKLQDKISGDYYVAKGKLVLNAGGPWANLIWNKLNLKQKVNLRRTKGVHLLTRKISNQALVLFAKSDGRLFFIIPWNECSLIGTTDTDYSGNPENVCAEKSDVDYLVAETRAYFPDFQPEDIYYTMAGLRPLVSNGDKDESNTSRAHRLIDHERKDGIQGLLSILGGKITAYRGIAEEAVNLACKKLRIKAACSTTVTPLPGAPALSQESVNRMARESGLSTEVVSHLSHIYGSRISQLLTMIKEDPQSREPLVSGYPDIRAQIKHAVREEEALTISDFILRRSVLGLQAERGQKARDRVTDEMGQLLGWNEVQRRQQIEDYQAAIDLGQNYRKANNT